MGGERALVKRQSWAGGRLLFWGDAVVSGARNARGAAGGGAGHYQRRLLRELDVPGRRISAWLYPDVGAGFRTGRTAAPAQDRPGNYGRSGQDTSGLRQYLYPVQSAPTCGCAGAARGGALLLRLADPYQLRRLLAWDSSSRSLRASHCPGAQHWWLV